MSIDLDSFTHERRLFMRDDLYFMSSLKIVPTT